MADVGIRAVITAQDQASAVLKNFGKNVDGASKDVVGGLSASTVALGIATAGVVAFGKKSLDAFNAQDLATVRLQTGINNVVSATDKHIQSLLDQATALQKTTRFSDEAYISAQGILSTFQLNQKAIEKLTPRLADMSEGLARVSGEMPDLEGNAILVAKAIGGEDVNGLTGVLRKAGVMLTKTQEALLKTGTAEERTALITQVLDQNFKGMAESAGGTTAGKMAILKNQFGEIEEKVGSLIATALTPLLNILIQHPAVLEAVTVAIGLLTTAIVGMKVYALITPIVTGLSAAFSVLTATSLATYAVLAAPLILVVVGVAAIWAAVNAVNALKDAWDNESKSEAMANDSYDNLVKNARTKYAEGKISKERLNALTSGRADGGSVVAGQPYMVGEVGKEMFVPNTNGKIIPNHQLKSGGSNQTVNVTFNGVFTGNEQEFRKLAVKMMGAFNDAQGMGNI